MLNKKKKHILKVQFCLRNIFFNDKKHSADGKKIMDYQG